MDKDVLFITERLTCGRSRTGDLWVYIVDELAHGGLMPALSNMTFKEAFCHFNIVAPVCVLVVVGLYEAKDDASHNSLQMSQCWGHILVSRGSCLL